ADDFLALGERAVGNGDLAVREPHADAVLARQQAAGVDEGAVLQGLLHELAHGLHQCGRRLSLPVLLGMADERQVFHGFSFGFWRRGPLWPHSSLCTGDERASAGSTDPKIPFERSFFIDRPGACSPVAATFLSAPRGAAAATSSKRSARPGPAASAGSSCCG